MANRSREYEEHRQWLEGQWNQFLRDRDIALTAGNDRPRFSDSILQGIAMDNNSNLEEQEVEDRVQFLRLTSATPPPRSNNSAQTATDVAINRIIKDAQTLVDDVQNLNLSSALDAQIEVHRENTKAADAEMAMLSASFDARVEEAITVFSQLEKSIQELKERAEQRDLSIAALKDRLRALQSKMDGMNDSAEQLKALSTQVELRMAAIVMRSMD